MNVTEFYVSVDIETAGPIPAEYSMLSIGACTLNGEVTFRCLLKPTTSNFVANALKVTGLSLESLAREGTEPATAMREFADWITAHCPKGQTPVFVGFNAPFDWSFINYYFHRYLGENPFGFSALDIKALYMGMANVAWNGTRSSKIAEALKPTLSGTHDALQDAKYQAELFRLILAARNEGTSKGRPGGLIARPILKIGPHEPHGGKKVVWIALSDAQLRTQAAGDLLVSRECRSVAELEAEIDQIRRDLDDVLAQARLRLGSE